MRLISRILAVLAFAIALSAQDVARAATATDALLQRLKPNEFVNDFASLLTPAQREALEARVRALQAKTGAELGVVTVSSLEGGEINDFANRLFNRWGIGQKGKNNGVLLLVAVQDRKMRIEVGYGLEPVLPDALAARIIDEELRPRFRQNNFAEGLKCGVERIAAIVEKGEPPSRLEMVKAAVVRPSIEPLVAQFGLLALFSLFVGLGCFLGGAGIGARQFFLPIWGAGFAGIPLVMAWEEGGFVFPALLVLAVVMLVLGIIKGIRNPRAFECSGSSGHGGGWSSGGGFSSGDGGGGFGGGSSGGGGASGSW